MKITVEFRNREMYLPFVLFFHLICIVCVSKTEICYPNTPRVPSEIYPVR